MPLDMRGDHRLQCIPELRGQRALFDQDLVKRPGLFRSPLRRRGDELIAVDQIHMQRQDSEEHIAIEV